MCIVLQSVDHHSGGGGGIGDGGGIGGGSDIGIGGGGCVIGSSGMASAVLVVKVGATV